MEPEPAAPIWWGAACPWARSHQGKSAWERQVGGGAAMAPPWSPNGTLWGQPPLALGNMSTSAQWALGATFSLAVLAMVGGKWRPICTPLILPLGAAPPPPPPSLCSYSPGSRR